MRLAAVVFDRPGGRSDFARLARALARSAAVSSPLTPLELIQRTPDLALAAQRPMPSDLGLVDNADKIVAWNEVVRASPDGEIVGLLDADTLVLGDLSEIEQRDFSILYTARPQWARLPVNGGVVFVRASTAAKDFFASWTAESLRLLAEPSAHRALRLKYGGLTQAALGALMPNPLLSPLPCAIWNCEHTTWSEFSAETKILHLMGRLRAAALGARPPEDDIAHLVSLWRRYED